MDALMTIPEVADVFRVSRSSVYPLIYSGDLETVDVGTGRRPRTRVTRESVERLLQRRAAATKGTGPPGNPPPPSPPTGPRPGGPAGPGRTYSSAGVAPSEGGGASRPGSTGGTA